MLRLVLVASLTLAAALVAEPATARADGPSPQLSFLARFTIDLTRTVVVEDELLVRMPETTEEPASSSSSLSLPGESGDVIALLGAGLDLSAEDTDEPTPVLLQFKPTFARRGGVLRCTFRF